jgi:hypothetical protein
MHGRHHLGGCIEGVLADLRAFIQEPAALDPRQAARAQERKLHGVTAVFVGDAAKRCVVAKNGNLEEACKLQVLAQLNEPRSV